ncbi:MAG TPA: MauE/DoxX family redox-associated membrane protein [Puia sp.]|nr:MauE/DoxX family redox-associated membrane protein [Puia sp.]
MFKKQVMLECISALLILLFLYASVSKFLDFKTFFKEMNNQPLPNSWTPFLVWFIPCSEILISVALIFERTRLLGLYGSLVLMGLFTIYAILILSHVFPYVPCSCGGVIKRLTWRQHLVLNLFFVTLSIIGVIAQRKKSFHSIVITKNSFV